MKRKILLVIAVVALAGGTLAFAAGLGPITTGTVGNAAASVNPCQSGGFTISYTTSAGNVTQVVIGGIQAACSGGALSVTLTDGTGAQIGSGGPVTIAGASATVPLTQQPYAGNVAGYTVVITGP